MRITEDFSWQFLALTCACLAWAVTEDSVAMESRANYEQVQPAYVEERKLDEESYYRHPIKHYRPRRIEKKRNLVHREREARGEWKAYSEGEVKGPIYELPPGYEIEGKFYDEPKNRYVLSQRDAGKRNSSPFFFIQLLSGRGRTPAATPASTKKEGGRGELEIRI